jgi:methionine-rich copper-binding protein CopC
MIRICVHLALKEFYDGAMKKFIGTISVLALISLSPYPAQAHTELVSSTPDNGAVITTWPTQVSLTFSEDLQNIAGKNSNVATVHNAIAEELNAGDISVVGPTITVPVSENSTPGLVLVSYRVASADGHVVEGEYTFNYGEANVTGTPYTVKKKSNTAIYGASTVLIVLTGLFGIWAYRRRRE